MRMFILLFGSLSLFLSPYLYAKEHLTVYTFSSFYSPYGPGKTLKEQFEKTWGCEVTFVTADTSPILLNRLRLEGKNTRADVVIGLDSLLIGEAHATGLFSPLKTLPPSANSLTSYPEFLPYSYTCLAIVVDASKTSDLPKSMDELIEGKHSLVLQDPRTSSTGLAFLIWMKKLYGKKAGQQWKRLQSKIITFTKGWGESYALFLQGEAPLVLAYMTSPLYHELVQGNDNYQALDFQEGHMCVSEYVAKIKTTKHPQLAEQFICYILSPEGQKIIAEKSWNYPLDKIPKPWTKARTFKLPRTKIPFKPEEIARNRKAWIQEWLDAII